MKVESVVNLSLSPEEWESMMSIALVAYGSTDLDLQSQAFAEEILIRGGAELDTDEDEQDATKH